MDVSQNIWRTDHCNAGAVESQDLQREMTPAGVDWEDPTKEGDVVVAIICYNIILVLLCACVL